MQRSADLPPQCALNPQDVTGNNLHQHHQARDDRNNYLTNRAPPARANSSQRYPGQQLKREPQRMSQPWSNPTFDNSNTSWEGDWSGTPPIKTNDSGAFYKQTSRNHPASYQSGSEWSPGESSASSSVASSYGMIQSPSNNSMGITKPEQPFHTTGGSYYENNGYYSSGYNNYGQGGYPQPNYTPQQTYQQPVRTVENYHHHQQNNRNTSICPPVPKPQMPDFQRRQNRYGMEGMPRVQIKQEPDVYHETESENFTSLFTQSLTSLYSQGTENDESGEPDIILLTPLQPPPPPPSNIPPVENQTAYQRLHSSGGHYTTSTPPAEYQDGPNNFGFYENRVQNCEPSGDVVQEIGSKGDRMNSFRYDRPSFDDMHLYASNPTDSKAQAKKRKLATPTAPPENFTENRKKASRMMSYRSETQWTPNSFGFDKIQIKQEPQDDYNSNEMETSMPFPDNSPGSSGNGNSKTSEQPKDHPKQPPRKRSPGTTCFDRFEKKSTPTNKKVSPLSVYAKVQESIVLSVKCRRYKKRTKPISSKEEAVCPGKEEMENYKRFSLTPDQGARLVMNELLERVSLYGERNAIGCPDLSQMDPYKLRDLFMQFCHRSNLDYRDFEDVASILRPRIVEDKMAKNSVRASAIRKRTSTSPVQASIEPPPVDENKEEPPVVVKTRRRRKKADLTETSAPFEKRVLRQLPGRVARNGASSSPVVTRRYSTRNSKEESRDSDVDIIIDLSTDREDEAGKEAEVRKKSQRLKKNKRPAKKAAVRDRSLEENEEPVAKAAKSKQSVGKKPAKEKSLDKGKAVGMAHTREESLDKVKSTAKVHAKEDSLENVSTKPIKQESFEETRRRTRSREKKVEIPKEVYNPPPRKRRSRLQRMSSDDSFWGSSVEIVDITRSSDSASPPVLDAIKIEPPAPKSEVRTKIKSTRSSKIKEATRKESLKIEETVKPEDAVEIEPPVLRRCVGRKRAKDAVKLEPHPLQKPAVITKRRNSSKNESSSLPVSMENIKTKDNIKIEPLSPTEDAQTTKFELFNGAKETEVAVSRRVADHSPAAFNSKKFIKTKIEEGPKNLAVKSGSSKRKQGGPTKFLKESFKSATFPTFLESNSNPVNPTPEVEQLNNKKFCNSNLLSKFSPSRLFNNISAVPLPDSANSSESLKERYRKSFCTEPLRNTPSKRHKELDEKHLKFSYLTKPNNSTKHLKESPLKIRVQESAQYIANSITKPREENSSKPFSNFLNKLNSSSSFMVKVKEEPMSEEEAPVLSTFTPGRLPATQTTPTSDGHKPVRNLPRRRSSQRSDSELQVVIKKLPDVQVDLQNGSVADELVRKCEEEQERMDAVIKEQELSDYDSDEEKPLFALKNSGWKLKEGTGYSESKCDPKEDLQASKVVKPAANLRNTRAAFRRRYSDSEDSECGLVIDLDRRLSVEERVPATTFKHSVTDEDLTETEEPEVTEQKESQTAIPNGPSIDSASFKSFSEDPLATKIKVEPVPAPPTEMKHSSLFRDATEEAHILLELSRGGMPPLPEEVAPPAVDKCEPTGNGTAETSEDRHCETKTENSVEQTKELDKDESILRTLLLENGDSAPGMSQDLVPQPSTSFESKHVPNQESMRLTSYQEFQANSYSSEIDEKKILEELQMNHDQLSSDINANFLPESYDWCLKDPKAIREVIEKLKNEIRYLQCMAKQKNRERTSIVCFKRYKEEILKRLMKKYAANNMKDASERFEQKSEIRNHMNGHQASALTLSPNGIHSRLSSALTSGVSVKSELPSATVTNGESYSSTSGENLPTVATMVANATENYGVDLRTVTSRKAATSSKTILQEALSSKEPIYRPVAIRSPLPPNERSADSLKVVQKSPLAVRESAFVPHRTSSPMLPELSRTSSSHLSRRLLGPGGSSQSPPSLQPELRQSSFTTALHNRKQQPISLVVTASETVATKTSHVSSPPSSKVPTPKCSSSSPRSSPKSNSLTMWSKLEAERSSSPNVTSVDLQTNPWGPNFKRSRTVDQRAHGASSNRPASVDMRLNHGSSNRSASVDLRTSHGSPNRPASVDLRTNYGSPNRPASMDLRTNHMSSNRSTPVGITNGHSSFMIVPPPTTLQSAFKERGRPKSEVRSSAKAMNGHVERIYEHRNEEEPQSNSLRAASPRFVPLAGPLTPIAPTSDYPKCTGCGIARGRYVCSGCERQLYCSAKCQSLRWAEHSKSCSSTHRKENSKSYN